MRRVNNLLVMWLTAKTYFYAESLRGCAIFTYKRWCRLWHLEVSRTRVARLSFTGSACCPSGRGPPVGSRLEKKKHHGGAKLCHFDWLGIIEAEDTGTKLFAFLPSYEESGTTFGASQNVLSKPYFINLSNYLARLSFCFSIYVMYLFMMSSIIIFSSFEQNIWKVQQGSQNIPSIKICWPHNRFSKSLETPLASVLDM